MPAKPRTSSALPSSLLRLGIVVTWIASFLLPAGASGRIRYIAYGDSVTTGQPVTFRPSYGV